MIDTDVDPAIIVVDGMDAIGRRAVKALNQKVLDTSGLRPALGKVFAPAVFEAAD
jgi:hypothetical protein